MCSIQTIAIPRVAQAARSSRRAPRPRRRSGRRRSRRGAAPPVRSQARAPARAACGASRPRLSRPAVGERASGRRARAPRGSARRPPTRACRPPAVAPTKHVLEHGHAAERPRHLVRAADAERQRSAAPLPVTSAPRNSDACPRQAGASPTRTFSSVVLPAPLGPTMPTASPAPLRGRRRRARRARRTACGRRPRRGPVPSDPRLEPSWYGCSFACDGTLLVVGVLADHEVDRPLASRS